MRPLLALALSASIAACEPDPVEATVSNELPAGTIETVWFRTTLFTQPLEIGQTSEALRVGTGVEPAYALVRIGGRTYAARTAEPVRAEAGESARIVFSAASVRSLCFGSPILTEEDYAFITSRIFPGDDVAPYDPALCTAPPPPSADASTD
jgi:hypothetical protein